MTYLDADIGTGASEVKIAVTTVPEPSAIQLGLAALATLVPIVWRRRQLRLAEETSAIANCS